MTKTTRIHDQSPVEAIRNPDRETLISAFFTLVCRAKYLRQLIGDMERHKAKGVSWKKAELRAIQVALGLFLDVKEKGAVDFSLDATEPR